MTVTFEVIGLPAPQGSKTRMPSGVMVEANKRTKPWRDSVAAAAREQADVAGMLDGPLVLQVCFRFPMPASRPKAVRARGEAWKKSTPDLDKLVRAVGDALTQSGLIADDARIVRVVAEKVEVSDWTGAVIAVGPVPEK